LLAVIENDEVLVDVNALAFLRVAGNSTDGFAGGSGRLSRAKRRERDERKQGVSHDRR
jgi:hypothetical protein